MTLLIVQALRNADFDTNKLFDLVAEAADLIEQQHEALLSIPTIAEEVRIKWDAGMKSGKLLIALIDSSLDYRSDTSAIHAAIAKAEVS